MKNKFKVILGTIVGIILGTSITAYAYNYQAKDIGFKPANESWEVDNVEDAVNELYSKANNTESFPYVEGIWSNIAKTVNYTYAVEEDGIYLAGGGAVGTSYINITTTAEAIEYTKNGSKLLIITAKNGDTITISGTNTYHYAGGYIARIHNCNSIEFIKSSVSSDTTVNSEYTALTDNEKILTIASASGKTRTESITFTGKFKNSYYHQNNCYVATSILSEGAKVSASAYGYEWSTAQTYIFKIK